MLDFVMIDDHRFVKDTRIISPKFIIKVPPRDLMIKGGEVYGIWDEETKLWVTEEGAINYLIKSVDHDLDICADNHQRMAALCPLIICGTLIQSRWTSSVSM